MYAVLKVDGKQYRVTEGQRLRLDTIDADEGASVEFDQVLMLGSGDEVKVGAPFVAGAKVKATIISHGRAKKIEIIKFKRRQHHMKHMGHRQNFTEVKVEEIAA
jgi:large subunit ribosomal protein L21